MEIYCRANVERSYSPALELVEPKLYANGETDPAGPTCTGWLFVLASPSGIDPVFHVLLAHLMRS